jgi:hypothetical protein
MRRSGFHALANDKDAVDQCPAFGVIFTPKPGRPGSYACNALGLWGTRCISINGNDVRLSLSGGVAARSAGARAHWPAPAF